MIIILKTSNKTVYHSFGFKIASEFRLPELSDMTSTTPHLEAVDVRITKSDLTALWLDSVKGDEFFIVSDHQVLFRVPDTAIFCMRDGNSIIVSPYEHADENKLRLYLLGTCMGIMMLQKKILPLHGSALAINGKAYAIVGVSGAGKSTLASILLERGYELLSDDLIAVTLDSSNIPIAMPAYPQQKIWQETIDRLGMRSEHLQPLFERETKFAVPVVSQFHNKPLPLAGIFELVKSDANEIIAPLNGLVRFHTLFQHTYRNFLIGQLGLMEWHFSTLARFTNQIAMYQLRRSASGFNSYELADHLLKTIQGES